HPRGFAPEIEIGMIGKVVHCRFGCSSGVIQSQTIVRCEAISDRGGELAREALISIRADMSHFDAGTEFSFDFFSVPHIAIERPLAAMGGKGAFVRCKPIGFTIKQELAAPNSVCESTDNCAEVRVFVLI